MDFKQLLKLCVVINLCAGSLLNAGHLKDSDDENKNNKKTTRVKEVKKQPLSRKEAAALIRKYQNPPVSLPNDDTPRFHPFTYKTPDGRIIHTE